MGRLSRTILGRVVSRKKGGHFTILLERGNQIEVKLKDSILRIGDKCNVCICNSTSKVLRIFEYSEDGNIGTMPLIKRENMPSPEEDDYDVEIEKECFLGDQSFETLEIGSSEILEWESSRDTEF